MTDPIPNPPPAKKGRHLYKHGFSGSRLYGRWHGMIQRCQDPNYSAFHRYGGRGITVCERWLSFENFLADMGNPPPGHEIDRIDNDRGYSPENCRWVSRRENMRNTVQTRVYTHNGETMCMGDWAARLGIDQATMRYRLENWPVEKALTTPNQKPRRVKNGV